MKGIAQCPTRFEKLCKEVGVSPGAKEQTSARFRKYILLCTSKARRNGVDLNEMVIAARQLGNSRTGLPYKTHGRSALVRGAMSRLTRQERIALNALAGTRPTMRNANGQLQPMQPMHGEWLQRLPILASKS